MIDVAGELLVVACGVAVVWICDGVAVVWIYDAILFVLKKGLIALALARWRGCNCKWCQSWLFRGVHEQTNE